MPDNEIVSRIAQKIRALRINKHLTISQLAEKTNVTKGLLSKIENSRTIPSLPVFVQILQSLDVSFKDFFEDIPLDSGKDYLVIRRGEYKSRNPESTPELEYRHIVTKIIPASSAEILLVTVKSGCNAPVAIVNGYNFKYVISGTCEYRLDRELVGLREGDSILFSGDIPHGAVNKSDKEALVLAVNFRF